MASSGTLVMVLSPYGTVIVQVAFPFTLLNRRAKNVMLVLLMLEHLGIAVMLGLPFFSLAVIRGGLGLPADELPALGRGAAGPGPAPADGARGVAAGAAGAGERRGTRDRHPRTLGE
ncbi:hypothetical protein SANTM175S_09574 [Streptomyces antimycoticus]